MPTRKAIVTVRKIQLAFLIKAGDAESVRAGRLFERRPITCCEEADAEFFSHFPEKQLHAFLFSKQVLKMCIHVEAVQLKSGRNRKWKSESAVDAERP